jgi:large subunit ribosomal protein L6
MSRIGKLPIPLPPTVKVDLADGRINVKGPKGELTRELRREVTVELEKDRVRILKAGSDDTHSGIYGLTRTLIANMIQGVTEGFVKVLRIEGVGYRAAVQGKGLQIVIGYSHPINIDPIPGIEFEVEKNVQVTVKGIDKELVGQVAANLRSIRPPEPYKGKGIRYADEVIHKKVGKAGKTGK